MQNRNKTFKIRSIVFTCIFLLILLFINLIITKVVNTYPLKIDVTSNDRFTLSKQSKDILGKLDKNITVYYVESEKKPINSKVAEIIDRYRKYSNGKIKIVSKDIVLDKAFASKFTGNISYGNIVFECGEVFKTEYAEELVSDQAMLYTAENTITNDIIYVSSNANSLVYNVTGHDEDDLGTVSTALNSENYSKVDIDLLTADIPRNVALLTVFGPKKDFDQIELAKINDFLHKGGSIQIYLDPDVTGLTKLYEFAQEWGIGISDNYVIEKDPDRIDMQSSDLMHPFITEYSFTEGNFNKNYVVIIKDSHALSYNGKNEQKAQNVISMLYTSKKAVSKTLADSTLVATGEQYISILSTRSIGDIESNVYVVGTTDLFDKDYFAEGSRYSNRDFYLKSVGWMCGFKDSIKISSKMVHSNVLTLTVSNGLKYTIVIFAISVIILIFGIIVWARRRYL